MGFDNFFSSPERLCKEIFSNLSAWFPRILKSYTKKKGYKLYTAHSSQESYARMKGLFKDFKFSDLLSIHMLVCVLYKLI